MAITWLRLDNFPIIKLMLPTKATIVNKMILFQTGDFFGIF